MSIKLASSATIIADRRNAKHTIGADVFPWFHDRTTERAHAVHNGTSIISNPEKTGRM